MNQENHYFVSVLIHSKQTMGTRTQIGFCVANHSLDKQKQFCSDTKSQILQNIFDANFV